MRWLLATVALLAAVAPAAASGPAAASEPTTLYLHLDGFQDFPASTQPPPADFEGSDWTGALTNTLDCVSGAGVPFTSAAYHSRFGHLFQGPVSYAGGRPRGDGEHHLGRSADVVLDPDAPAALRWFVSPRLAAPASPLDAVPQPVPAPRVALDVEVRAFPGTAWVADRDGFASGRLVAHGSAGPALLAGPLTQGASHDEREGQDVYGFEVPLAVLADRLPADEAVAVRVRVFLERDGCPADGTVMTNTLPSVTDPDHRPRIEWSARGTLGARDLRAVPNPAGLILVANVTDPWGAYDVAGATLEVQGPLPMPERPALEIVQLRDCHCPDAPLWVAAVWKEGRAVPPGPYEAILRATSLQGHAMEARFAFTVPAAEDAQEESPEPAPALAAAGLAAAAALRRRRA